MGEVASLRKSNSALPKPLETFCLPFPQSTSQASQYCRTFSMGYWLQGEVQSYEHFPISLESFNKHFGPNIADLFLIKKREFIIAFSMVCSLRSGSLSHLFPRVSKWEISSDPSLTMSKGIRLTDSRLCRKTDAGPNPFFLSLAL